MNCLPPMDSLVNLRSPTLIDEPRHISPIVKRQRNNLQPRRHPRTLQQFIICIEKKIIRTKNPNWNSSNDRKLPGYGCFHWKWVLYLETQNKLHSSIHLTENVHYNNKACVCVYLCECTVHAVVVGTCLVWKGVSKYIHCFVPRIIFSNNDDFMYFLRHVPRIICEKRPTHIRQRFFFVPECILQCLQRASYWKFYAFVIYSFRCSTGVFTLVFITNNV